MNFFLHNMLGTLSFYSGNALESENCHPNFTVLNFSEIVLFSGWLCLCLISSRVWLMFSSFLKETKIECHTSSFSMILWIWSCYMAGKCTLYQEKMAHAEEVYLL